LTPDASPRHKFGAVLQRLRDEAGLSQSALGQLVHYSGDMIGAVEKAERWPTPKLTAALDQALDSDGTLTRLLPAVEAQRAAEQENKTRDVANGSPVGPATILLSIQMDGSPGYVPSDRRELLRNAGITLGGLTFDTNAALSSTPAAKLEDLRHLKAALDDAHRFLDADVVAHFRRLLDAAISKDGNNGPRDTLPVVFGILSAIETSARDVKPSIRRQLLRVGAECAELAGWLFRDLSSPTTADYWRDRAIEWAQESGDQAMQGYVLLKKAQAAYDERDALRMLTLAQAVQEGPWLLPHRVRAEAAQQEARGEAMLGGAPEQIERKLDEARQLLAKDDPDEEREGGDLARHYGPVLLAVQTAICHKEAGRPAAAVRLYEQQLSEGTFSRRDHGYFSALMADALALSGEPDEAARVGLQALAVASTTGSARTLRELHQLVNDLGPWTRRQPVAELREAVLAVAS
jgi:transcriptional regulator with XRE-family HTH domain